MEDEDDESTELLPGGLVCCDPSVPSRGWIGLVITVDHEAGRVYVLWSSSDNGSRLKWVPKKYLVAAGDNR